MAGSDDRIFAVLLAPSRYDERGVRIFRVGINQNGSLGTIVGLIEDYNRRHRGRRNVDFEVFDEHVREAVTPDLLGRWQGEARARQARFVLLLCGVQTPFYPRARDIALMARRLGITVVAGGVHFSAHGPSVDFFTRCGISVGIGEVEPLWDRLMDDLFAETLAPLYRIAPDQGLRVKTAVEDITAPDLGHVPFPHMPRQYLSPYFNKKNLYIDTSRGCPFVCSFCVVKNTNGRTVRSRDPRALVAWMGERVESGDARWFTFTDDNFLRNPLHLQVLEGLARLRERGLEFFLTVTFDVQAGCYAREDSARGKRTREFIALCQRAGVTNVSMGLESTNAAALEEMHKNINRGRALPVEEIHEAIIERYRTAVRAFQEINCSVECGCILGFEADQLGAGVRAARDMVRIGPDIVNFHLVVPLPGAEDYARAVREGRLLVSDFNQCFRHVAMLAHPTLSPTQLEQEMTDAIRVFYSFRNVALRLLKGAVGIGRPRVADVGLYAKRQLGFKLMLLSGLDSYSEGGLFRRRTKVQRMAVTDAEALAHYLPDGLSRPSVLPSELLDESDMTSLPVLRRHDLSVPSRRDTGAVVPDEGHHASLGDGGRRLVATVPT